MKFGFVTQFWLPEPAVLQVAVAEELAQAGHQVRVLTGFPNYPGGKLYPGYKVKLFQREDHGGCEVLRLPLYPSHDDSPLRRALNYLTFGFAVTLFAPFWLRDVDAIYAYHPPGTVSFVVALYGRLRGKPTLIHIQDLWPDSVVSSGFVTNTRLTNWLERALKWMDARTRSWATRIAVLSPGFKRILSERGTDPAKVDVVYNWADEAIWCRAEKPTQPSADRANLAGRFVVMFAGNIGHFQGLDSAIRAAVQLKDEPEFRLALVGSGQAVDDLVELASTLAADNVVFLDRVEPSEMPGVAQLADIQLVSLEDRPFFAATIPGKTQQILAAGHPLIAAIRGDAAELVAQAGAGIVVPPGDEVALAAAFRKALSLRGDTLKRMGESGRNYYEAFLSRSRASDYFVGTMTRLAAQR